MGLGKFFKKLGNQIGDEASRAWDRPLVRNWAGLHFGGIAGLAVVSKNFRRATLPYVPLIGTAYTGQIAAREQKRALVAQEQAQKVALGAAERQRRLAEEAENKANMKTPDISGLLTEAQRKARLGPAGSMLTGARGVDPTGLQLGRKTLLGS
jgi:hypothetical protein